MSVSVKDTDNGYTQFRAAVFDDGKNKLDVGIFADAASKSYPDGVSVLMVAIWNEFGVGAPGDKRYVPQRSFIRAWFDEHQEDVLGWFSAEMVRVLDGSQSKIDALEAVGKKCVQGIKNRIEIGVPPPNAASTVAKKGFDHALRESGFMESVITYRVEGTRGPSKLRVAIEHAIETVGEAVGEAAEAIL